MKPLHSPGADDRSGTPAPLRGRVSWVALVTLAVLAIGVGIAALQWRRPAATPPAPAGEVDAPSDSADDVIRDALAQATAVDDSTALKRGWVGDVRGLDVSMLSAAEEKCLVEITNARSCSCGCGFTLAACRAWDTTCPVSLPQVEALRDSIHDAR